MKIRKEEMLKYGKTSKFYPPWRKPFRVPSFLMARWLVNHGLKNPQRISYLMIILGFTGGTMLLSNSLLTRIAAWCILMFAYFIDMQDGKTARMLHKDYKGLIGYLDNQFHVPITAYILFILSLRLYLNTDKIIFVLIGFILPWIFLWKAEMQFSYEIHLLEVMQPDDLSKYEDEMAYNTYHKLVYDTKGIKKHLYTMARPFLDATDIWFALLPVMILQLDALYLLILLIIHSMLLLYKLKKNITSLKGE